MVIEGLHGHSHFRFWDSFKTLNEIQRFQPKSNEREEIEPRVK